MLHRADPSAEEQQRIWDDIQRRRIEEREAEMRRLEQNEEQLKLAEEQRRILEEIQRKEKERKMEEDLSMKLILQMTSRERPVPVTAPSRTLSQNQYANIVKPPPEQIERGNMGDRSRMEEALGWQEVKRSGRGGDSQEGRNLNWPPLKTCQTPFSQGGGGLRGIGQDISRSDSKGLKSNYKTVLCEFWNTTGRCQYGPGCHFAHGEGELKRGEVRQNRVQHQQQQQQQQRAKKEGRAPGGGSAALKAEAQRRAAYKVCDYILFLVQLKHT